MKGKEGGRGLCEQRMGARERGGAMNGTMGRAKEEPVGGVAGVLGPRGSQMIPNPAGSQGITPKGLRS